MRKITYTLLTILFVSSNIFSLDTISGKFMPLKIGNSWTYRHTGGFPPPIGTTYYYTCKVTRDTVISGHKYYFLDKTEHFFPSSGSGNWLRIDSSDGKLINFRINSCGNSNFYTIDSLSSAVNDFSRICPNDTLTKRKLMSVVNNVRWGMQTIDLGFNWNGGPAANLRTYSKYLGLSFSGYGEMNPTIYTLMGCVIDGVLYGDTNTFVGLNQISSEIPDKFSLSQNYPNPFNPVTQIRFAVSGTSAARTFLSVYDLLGREVAILVNEELQPGSYEADWNAADYPSGVYYYKLESGSYAETKKMVLIK